MEQGYTFDDLEDEFNKKQAVVTNNFWQFLDELKKLRAELNELETKPMYGGGIWIRDGKYAYKVYTPERGAKRVREYYGKDIAGLHREMETYSTYVALKEQFDVRVRRIHLLRRRMDELSGILVGDK